eukprot:5744977-Prymnesium_polylepis.1
MGMRARGSCWGDGRWPTYTFSGRASPMRQQRTGTAGAANATEPCRREGPHSTECESSGAQLRRSASVAIGSWRPHTSMRDDVWRYTGSADAEHGGCADAKSNKWDFVGAWLWRVWRGAVEHHSGGMLVRLLS